MNPEPSSQVSTVSADEAALQALAQQLNDAWARADADGFAALFTEEADYVVFDGSHLKGRAAIAESHRALFQFMKGSRLVVTAPPSVRFLAPDVAVLHGMGAVLRAGQKRPSRRALSVQTFVAIKQGGPWRFTAFQNTRYRPFAQTFMGRVLTWLSPKSLGASLSVGSPDTAR
jgi:uncharacterized protein (TIGR02246 family)